VAWFRFGYSIAGRASRTARIALLDSANTAARPPLGVAAFRTRPIRWSVGVVETDNRVGYRGGAAWALGHFDPDWEIYFKPGIGCREECRSHRNG